VRGHGTRYGVFVNDDWELSPQWRLALGARADRLLNGEAQATPRLGVVWSPVVGMHWKLLRGRAFREPNAVESQFTDSAASLPNPALGVERLHSTELALDWRVATNVRLAASIYRNHIDGLITQQVVAGSELLQYVNLGSASASGTEFELDHVADNGWRTRVSLSVQRTRDGESGQPLVNSPRSLVKLHLTGPLPLVGLRVGIEGHHVGRRRTVSGETVPPYSIANLHLQWAPAGSRWTAQATLHNAFDRRYADPAGPEHRQSVLARDGRRWTLQTSFAY
jgi:outer membrane receptor protein involved in Fe transport